MRTQKFWVPVVCSLIVTPVALVLGAASGGAGHGNYLAAMILFPYTMLSAGAFDYIHAPFIVLAIAQFPVYRISLGYANERGRFARTAIILLVVHVVAVGAILHITNESFS